MDDILLWLEKTGRVMRLEENLIRLGRRSP